MIPFQMEILPLGLLYVWSSVCGHRGQWSLQKDKRDDDIRFALITAQTGRVKWTRSQWVLLHRSVCVCVLSVSSGKCQTWCWLIPSQRTFLRRTNGKSTGEFIAAFRDVGRTELQGKGRRKGGRSKSMKREQEIERDVEEAETGEGCGKKRSGKEDWENERGARKGAKRTIRSSEGQRGADKTWEAGRGAEKRQMYQEKKGLGWGEWRLRYVSWIKLQTLPSLAFTVWCE